MIDKLKPCPFCGGSARLFAENPDDSYEQWVVCNNCGSEGSFLPKQQAIEAWNRRTNE